MNTLFRVLALTSLMLCFAELTSANDLTSPSFRPIEIDAHLEIGYGVAVADVDGDQRPDVLLADKKQIAWYRNPKWEKFVIAENLTTLDNVCIAAVDTDGDGKAEVALGAGWNPSDTLKSGAVFYLVPPPDRTSRWDPVALPHEPTVHRMRWIQDRGGELELVVVPLHGRGNENSTGVGVKILTYKKPADPREPWATELINDALHATHNFESVGWIGSSGTELLIAGKEGVFHCVRSATGWKADQLPGVATQGGAGEVRAGKLPGASNYVATIEPMHGNQLVVYTLPESGADAGLWTRQVLSGSLKEGHALACGDVLGAGSDQVVAGWRGKNSEGKVGIKLFWSLDPTGTKWKEATVDDTVACEDLCVADLDRNGMLDIVAAGRSTRNLKIFFNETRAVRRHP